MPRAIGQTPAVVVPSHHEIAKRVDGRSRKELEAVIDSARLIHGPSLHGGHGPCQTVIGRPGEDYISVVTRAVNIIGVIAGDYVNRSRAHGVGQHPRLDGTEGPELRTGNIAAVIGVLGVEGYVR